MARHHHHHHASQGSNTQPQQRPLILRIISILGLILPPIFYIICLSFTLKTIYSKNYSEAALFNSSGHDSGIHLFASPFYSCAGASSGPRGPINSAADFNETCTRRAFLGSKGMAACLAAEQSGSWPNTQYCQKTVASASMYVAAAVLVGISLLAAAVYAAVEFRAAAAATTAGPAAAEKTGAAEAAPEQAATAAAAASSLAVAYSLLLELSVLLALLAVLCLVAAQAVGISATVTDRMPTAGQTPSQSAARWQGRWFMGKPALVYTSVAWLSAVLGVFIAFPRG